MKQHIIDADELENLIKTETDKGWYSVPVDELRALISNSPQADGMVLAPKNLTAEMFFAWTSTKVFDEGLPHERYSACYKAMLSAYKPQADDVRKDEEGWRLCDFD